MRVKTYQASSMSEAMACVRAELGEEAIIVTSENGVDGGCWVTAAIEEPPVTPPESLETPTDPEPSADVDPIHAIAQQLRSHGIPQGLVGRLCRTAKTMDGDRVQLLLAGALDSLFRFTKLPEPPLDRPFFLMGAPGSGKTIAAAKLATRAVMNDCRVRLISTDTQRAGGAEQLAAFARILNVPMDTVASPDDLHRALLVSRGTDAVIIDTPGVNPFLAEEAERLAAFAHAAEATGLLIASAGSDALDAAEQAEAFADLGAHRLVATKLDLGRRLGGLLAAADAGALSISAVSISHAVADPLLPINPMSLARLIDAGADDLIKTMQATEFDVEPEEDERAT